MKRCLKVTIKGVFQKDFLPEVIKKIALDCSVEGTAQYEDTESVKIIACGSVEQTNEFIDSLHTLSEKQSFQAIEVEPFLNIKNYRNTFRILS
ncbi:acylphosphatase [bacterium]|nr:MAG: acylphosphatase [bacterium]QQR61649.1 MAG: acylphosphatase [bacterium]QQR62786.1 MAG: acylphosphatase [bacterium]